MERLRTLNDIVEHFEKQLKETPISHERYQDWLSHPVTQKMHLDCSRAILEAILNSFDCDRGVENAALHNARSQGMKEAFEIILEWTPEEYI